MVEPLLSVENLNAGYGRTLVLHQLSLTVNTGEIVALIGANGAGKTTLLRCISRSVLPSSGTLRFGSADLTQLVAHQLPSLGLAHVPEGRKIFPRLTVEENLLLGGYTRSDSAEVTRSIADGYELFPRLGERRHQLGGTLSGGEQQMLAITRALISKPRCLLLDEPSMGIAPLLVTQIFKTLRELRDRLGITILLVEQNARQALRLADRGYVLELGRITCTGPGAELLNNQAVQGAYLGGISP